MTITGGNAPQQTRLDRARGRRLPPAPEATIALDETAIADGAPPPTPRKTIGIVFVHGIGNQKAGETLLDWSSAIVRSLGAWQTRYPPDEVIEPWTDSRGRRVDPIVRSQIDFSGATFPLVEIQVPGLAREGQPPHHPQRWLVTETWWSNRLAEPNLSAVADWSGRQGIFGRVVDRIIRNGAGSGIPGADVLARLGLGVFLSLLATLALLGFSAVRALAAIVPIQAFKDAVVIAQFESFMVGWWGDAYQLMRDPVQSANVRGRLLDAVGALDRACCDEIVIIAHSGGTIVSYMTLVDRAVDDPGTCLDVDPLDQQSIAKVTKLITHGEAIDLVRSFAPGLYELEDGPTIGASSGAHQRIDPDCRSDENPGWAGQWIDFWATHDPAPSGPVRPEIDHPDRFPRFRSHMVWNRRSLMEDHGEYWNNEEEFVLPILRELDTAGGNPADSRFPLVSCDAVTDRHQRVHILTMWRRFAFVAPFAAILGWLTILSRDAAAATDSPPTLSHLTDIAGAAWSIVPASKDLDAAVGALATVLSPATDVIGALATGSLVAVLLGLAVHAALPVGQATVWLRRPLMFVVAAALDLLPLIGIPILTWVFAQSTVAQVAAATSTSTLPFASAVAIGVGALLVIRAIGWAAWRDALSVVAIVVAIVALGSIILAFLTRPDVHQWIVGAVIAFALFRPLVGYGAGRWQRWDAIERDAARHGLRHPARVQPTVEAIVLLAIGVLSSWSLIERTTNPFTTILVATSLFVLFIVITALADARSADQGTAVRPRLRSQGGSCP